MTETTTDEVFIVGSRYGELADAITPLYNMKRPIVKKDITDAIGDDVVYLKPVPNDHDPYAVAVYNETTKRIGFVWMYQAPTMRYWMESHERQYIRARVTRVNLVANVLTAEMDIPLDVPLQPRCCNDIDLQWASNLPYVLKSIAEQSLDLGLMLLLDELPTATEWNERLEMRIDNLLKAIPLDLSAFRHNVYMEVYSMMSRSEIKEVREQSDYLLNTLIYRGSREHVRWWSQEWLPSFFRETVEGDLLGVFESAHYTLETVEELLDRAPENLFHLYKVNKDSFVNRLYYYAFPQEIYYRLLTLLAVREALLGKKEGTKAAPAASSQPDKEVAKCFKFPSDFTKQKVESVVKSLYHGEHTDLALLEITLFDHGQLKKRNSHTAFVNVLVSWGLVEADPDGLKQIISGIKDKYKRLPTDGYKEWDDVFLNDRNTCIQISKILGETMKYQR